MWQKMPRPMRKEDNALIPSSSSEQVLVTDSTSLAPPALSGNDLLLWAALPDLTLNIAQTATLCGVSVRQLGYWTKQGYVTATGQGARRLYGPESLRRILAIRQAMQDGLSLRQSLRALAAIETHGAPPSPSGRSLSEEPREAAPPPLADAEAVAAELLALFAQNRHTRDSVGGLSAKLGRAEVDVRQVAERLTAQGTLRKMLAGAEPVYVYEGGKTL